MNAVSDDTATRARRARPMTPDDRRASIVDVAIPLILEHGADVTTRQIAEAARIAEGTVFRAFADKNELIDAAIARVMDPAETVRMLEQIDPAQSLEAKIQQIVTLLHGQVSGAVRFMSALGPRDHARREKHDHDHRRPPLSEATDAVARLLAPDTARLRVPVAMAVDYVRILVFGTAIPFVAGDTPADPAQLADFILHGIATEGD